MRINHTPGDRSIFVFGSNLLGIHGAGAALYAQQKLGAVRGVAMGHMSKCYALPTCSVPGVPLELDEVAKYVGHFLYFATEHPELSFYVSAVGCGFAGFKEEEIAPLFKDAPPNCDLPDGWRVLTIAS